MKGRTEEGEAGLEVGLEDGRQE